MSSELRKSAEFFVELAEGLTRLTQDKDKLVQLVNYEVAALLNSLSKGARLRERDFEQLFRAQGLPYNRVQVRGLLFKRSTELTAQSLCDYLGIGRIYAQKKYSSVRLSQQDARRFLELVRFECEFTQKMERQKSSLNEPAHLRELFGEIDFFQNGYMDAYSMFEFIKYYTNYEVDPLISAQIVQLFSKSQSRIDLQAFLSFFQSSSLGLSSAGGSLNASMANSSAAVQAGQVGRIQKNSPQRALNRYKSEERLLVARESETGNYRDRSDSMDRFRKKERELRKRHHGLIPDRYKDKIRGRQNPRDPRKTNQKEVRELKSRAQKMHLESDAIESEDRERVPKDRRKQSNRLGAFKNKHPRNFEILQNLKCFKEDRSLETLVSQFENPRRHETLIENNQESKKYQDYLAAKNKNRVKEQIRLQIGKLAVLLENREDIIKQLVKVHNSFNAFNGFNVIDEKQVGFLDFREFFKALQDLGIEVPDENKKSFWKETSTNSIFAFQNYLSLFDLKFNRVYYDDIKSREATLLDFTGIQSWSSDLQNSYLNFLCSIVENTAAIRRQKTSLCAIIDTLSQKNLPRFMTDKNEIGQQQFTKLFGQKSLKVFLEVCGGLAGPITSEKLWRYTEARHK